MYQQCLSIQRFDVAELSARKYIGRYPPKKTGRIQVLNTAWFLTISANRSFAGTAVKYRNPPTSAGGDVQSRTAHAAKM